MHNNGASKLWFAIRTPVLMTSRHTIERAAYQKPTQLSGPRPADRKRERQCASSGAFFAPGSGECAALKQAHN